MHHAKPLPSYLAKRYHGWKATAYEESKAWFRRLADEGQRPRAMVIACCDSRVQATALFGAEQGEFFIHRNIANLVPPHEPDGAHHGTSAAVEYAVTVLKVAHLLVLGHSNCGGVKGCAELCAKDSASKGAGDSYVTTWIELLRPAWEKVQDAPVSDSDELLQKLEKQGVVTSLDNLITFPFVHEAVEAGELSLHGLWIDIREGELEYYDTEAGSFVPV